MKESKFLGCKVVWTSSANGTSLTKLGMVIAEKVGNKWMWLGPAWSKIYMRSGNSSTRYLGPRCEVIVELYATKPSPRHRVWNFLAGKPRYMYPRINALKLCR